MSDIIASARLAVPLIKKLESCVLTAYPDPASHGDPWTIGYGATGPEIHQGVVWSQAQADEDLAHQCASLAIEVNKLLRVQLSDQSRAALISFAYNVGPHALSESTLLRLINAGHPRAAADEFRKWTHANGRTFPGLINRRETERQVFLNGLTPEQRVA